MSSDAEGPRQRTVAELLAAHGDTAVTGRRARRRAAEDAAGTGQAVVDAPVSTGLVQPASNGSGGGTGADPAPYRNGSPGSRPAPGVNRPGVNGPRANGAGANGAADSYGGPYVNGGGAANGVSAPPTGDTYGAPYTNGTGEAGSGGPASTAGEATYSGPPNIAGDTRAPFVPGDTRATGDTRAPSLAGDTRAPYVNGTTSGGPATRPGDGYDAPYANGASETGYRAPSRRPADDTYGAPHVNGGDTTNGGSYGNRGRGGSDPGPAPRQARRGTALPDDVGAFAPPVDSGAAFVNGGAVDTDTEATAYRGGTPWTADRSVLREPVPREADAPVNGQAGASTRRGPEAWAPPSGDKARARPTEQMPRLRSDRTPMLDAGLTGPIEVQRLPQADVADEGPPTAVGMAPAGAEGWHRERTSRRAGRDGGPPTAATDLFDDDDDDLPAGLSDEPGLRRGTSPVVGQSTGQAWAAVVAQWIAGAIGGAALWVGFRFLWRDLPVVALAAAALVTVGLVLVVRALMRNDDRRTTLFAVLVGLLLTVSPAILVLLGR
jgi:hypothetical protein